MSWPPFTTFLVAIYLILVSAYSIDRLVIQIIFFYLILHLEIPINTNWLSTTKPVAAKSVVWRVWKMSGSPLTVDHVVY